MAKGPDLMSSLITLRLRRFDGTLSGQAVMLTLPVRMTVALLRARLALAMQRFRVIERAHGHRAGPLALHVRMGDNGLWVPVFEAWDGQLTRERLRLHCPFRTDWDRVRHAIVDTRARWWMRTRPTRQPPRRTATILPLFRHRHSAPSGDSRG
jgi:hypothetical protein